MKQSVILRQKGLTLAEVIIVLGISAVVGLLLMNIFVQNNQLLYQQSAKVSQGVSLNDAVNAITNDIKSASAVAAGYPIGSPTILSSDSGLVLQIPSIDSNNNIINQTYDYTAIFPDAANQQLLREQIYPDPQSSRQALNRVLVSNLSLIKFSYLDSSGQIVTPTAASAINLTINLKQKVGMGNEQSSSSAQVHLRNT